MYDVDDERYLNPDNKSYRDLLSDNLYLEDRLQELEDDYEELKCYNEKLQDYCNELENDYNKLESKYDSLKSQETKMIQLLFDNRTLEKENKKLKEKYNTLINKLKV